MSIKSRYKYFPQMETYDNIANNWLPFLMFFHQPNYSSPVLNTDSNGFRFAGKDGRVRLDNFDNSASVNIIAGGSSAFGSGATSDGATIPAVLSEKTGQTWMNFGGRAHISTQEFITFAYHRHMLGDINNIVIFSGINDLYLYFASKSYNKYFGSSFYGSEYIERMSQIGGLKKQCIDLLINKVTSIIPFMHAGSDKIFNKDSFGKLIRNDEISVSNNHNEQGAIVHQGDQYPNTVIDVLRKNIRNWQILSNHYDAKLTYVLQPFANWLPNRTFTETEIAVFGILDQIGGGYWKNLSSKINMLHQWYANELSVMCKIEGCNFIDTNPLINSNTDIDLGEAVFVDRAHLTDYGNKKVSEYILGTI